MYFKELYYINLGESYDTPEQDLTFENVSDNPMRFFYLLGWYHRNHIPVNWVITPNTVNIRGVDYHLYFYVGHVIVRGHDLVKFKLVSQKENLDL